MNCFFCKKLLFNQYGIEYCCPNHTVEVWNSVYTNLAYFSLNLGLMRYNIYVYPNYNYTIINDSKMRIKLNILDITPENAKEKISRILKLKAFL